MGVDNGKGGGWERIRGPHAVKLFGRTYHYMPRSNTTGGIQHFIMDKYTEALMHGQSFQTKSSEKTDSAIKDAILRTFWDTLHRTNRWVQHCKIIGEAVKTISDQNWQKNSRVQTARNKTMGKNTDNLCTHRATLVSHFISRWRRRMGY
jgi:hypothetical protein